MFDGMFVLWSWPAALALLLLGMASGWLLIPLLWPLRRSEGLRLPVLIFGLLALIVPTLFFLFLGVLRAIEDRAIPWTSWAQWCTFAIGMWAGLWLEERRHLEAPHG